MFFLLPCTWNGVFFKAAIFNQDISTWDTSSVTEMRCMFFHAKRFNQPIGSWCTSACVDMSCMLWGATDFNHDISQWEISPNADSRYIFTPTKRDELNKRKKQAKTKKRKVSEVFANEFKKQFKVHIKRSK